MVGARVAFILGANNRGPCARQLIVLDEAELPPNTGESAISDSKAFMAQAVIARDSRQFEQAERLYRKALDLCPSPQVILSFAAMEKNRGRKKEAMDIYLEGIEKVPVRKIFEDAATLATSLGRYSEARRLLSRALGISKPGTQGGIYLALARNAFKENTLSTLKEAVEYYERSLQTLSPASFPRSDRLCLNIAKLRTQHHRGNLAYGFFSKGSFKILDVEFFDSVTEGADLVVNIASKELLESFGVEPRLLVRVYFKTSVSLADIDSLSTTIASRAIEHGTDEQVCLVVTSSLPDDLKRVLFGRVENKNKLYPAIVPIPQDIIETETPETALNETLGQWLYRRDLFNVNFPVVGRKFFGRNRDLDELKDAITDSIPVGLFGLRKVGKTSLLKELARRGSESGDLYVYIDLLRIPGDVTDLRWVYWRLADELFKLAAQNPRVPKFKWRFGGQYESFLDVPISLPVATAFDADLTSLLKAIESIPRDPRPKVVVLLDEIERLLPTAQGKEGLAGYFDFFSYLRGVSQETNHFCLVVTGANAAISEVAQFEGRDNPAFNFFKQIYLRLLPSPDCNAMLTALGRGMGVKFTKGAIPRIVSLTGGHPFFSRQLCSYLAERHKDRPLEITAEMIDKSLEQYILFCDKDMQEIFDRLSRDYPDERDFCVALADGKDMQNIPLYKSVKELSGTALRHLIGYQLIELIGDSAQFTMDLLRLWIDRRMGDGA